MKGMQNKKNDRRRRECRPLSPTLVDLEIQALGGTTTAFDTMAENIQAAKDAPTSVEERIIELTRENGRLRQEIGYYRTLVDGLLTPLMPVVQFHVNGLHTAVQRCNANIEHANAQWQKDKTQGCHVGQGYVSHNMESFQ